MLKEILSFALVTGLLLQSLHASALTSRGGDRVAQGYDYDDQDDAPFSSSDRDDSTRPFVNLAQIAATAGFDKYRSVVGSRTLRVAIIDEGFRGYRAQIGVSLPRATFAPAPLQPIDPKEEQVHGLKMAQIVAGLLREVSPKLDYELHLFTGKGYSNFEQAVNAVAKGRFDVVLYSAVWEYGGNGDGRGFINALVNRAAQSGVTWINAAGNYGDALYQGAVRRGEDDWAKLPGKNSSVQIRCEKNARNACRMKLILTWNSFADNPDTGTDKDLDLVLSDDAGKIINVSGLKQIRSTAKQEQGETLYPREIVTAEVPAGLYLARVKIRSNNFSQADKLKISLLSDFAKMENATPGETILSPADNENVITVGADDKRSSSSRVLAKPELIAPSEVVSPNGERNKGSSSAAAVAAAGAVLLKAVRPNLTRIQIVKLLGGISADDAETSEADCYRLTKLPFFPAPLKSLASMTNLYVVATEAGPKVLVNDDPFALAQSLGANVIKTDDDDMLVVDARGFNVLPRTSEEYMPPGSYEVLQSPAGGSSICPVNDRQGSPRSNIRTGGARLRMPRLSEIR